MKLRRAFSALQFSAIVCLSGCLSVGSPSTERAPEVLRQASLADGRVIVVPPQGYCVEEDSFRTRSKGGFALLASCESLTGYASGYDVEPAVMTVTAVPRASNAPEPAPAEIAALFGAPKLLDKIDGDGLTLVQVEDPSPFSDSGDAKHWRGLMVLNGHLVGLALYGAKDSALTGNKGRNLLIWLAEQMRQASPLMVRASSPEEADAIAEQHGLRPKARPGSPVVAADPIESDKNPAEAIKKLFNRMFLS